MEKLKKILAVGTKVAILIKKVKADGKLDMADAVHVVPFVTDLPESIAALADFKEAIAEIKAIDVASGLGLVQFIDAQVKLVEKA